MLPKIKICGLKDVPTALAVARTGVDAIGLVFYPPSPRHVELEMAADIARAMPPFVSVVGLFVDPEAGAVRAALSAVMLDVLQFHGDEPADFCRQFARPYIKAVRVKPGLDLLEYAAGYPDACGLLCDAWSEKAPGGTGDTFDWDYLPSPSPLPLILSGGLNPDNVAAAIKRVRPWAVDVSSGVEMQRGIKDPERVVQFVRAARGASVLADSTEPNPSNLSNSSNP